MENKKNAEEALNVLANASGSFVGTRRDHEVIIQALEVLRKAVLEQAAPAASEAPAADAS